MQKLGGSPFKVSLGKQFSEILFQKHPTQKRIDRVAKALSSNSSTTKKKKKKTYIDEQGMVHTCDPS
jgi:hypothetical protein